MFSSPAKRRKLSPISADALNPAPDTEASARLTPRRASFQSPTKASLARFNPGLIPRSGSQSPGKQSVQPVSNTPTAGDTDEIRRKRVALFERLAPVSDTKENKQPRSENDVVEANVALNPGSTISQPPRRRSLSPVKLPTVDPTPEPVPQSRNSESLPQAQALDKPGAMIEEIPQQAGRMRRTRAPVLPVDEAEPELPPTPVELGWEAQAPPPSGILSSSPSTRSSRRKTRKASEGVKSSPLKPRDQRPGRHAPMGGDDVPLLSLRPKQPEFSEEVLRKQQVRDELAAQLEQLKGDVEMLEKEMRGDKEGIDLFGDVEDNERELISLLTTSNPSCAPLPPLPPKQETLSTLLHAFLPFAPARPPPLTETEPVATTSPGLTLKNSSEILYLTLFTPLLLSSTTTTTISPTDQKSPLQTHALTLSAPPPFKPSQFSFTFQLTTSPLFQTVISLSLTSFALTHAHAPLLKWITRRLQSPLFAQDMPGLGCGIGRYWEACIERARIWKGIEDALPEFVANTIREAETSVRIEPYLTQSSLTLRNAGGGAGGKGLLITYDLCVSDWTGEVSVELGICTQGFGGRVEEGVKRAFKGLVKKVGVVRAVRGVVRMILES